MANRGTIVGLFKESGGSGIALLGIGDDVKGKTLISCDGNPTGSQIGLHRSNEGPLHHTGAPVISTPLVPCRLI